MTELSTSKIRRWYFIKNGVVFEISGTNPDNDPCGKKYDDNSLILPSVTINNKVYYLDCMITDGDTYSSSTKKFTKVVHPGSSVYGTGNYTQESPAPDGTADETMTYDEYYRRLCMISIDNGIVNNFNNDWTFFRDNQHVLNVPKWFIKNNGDTVSPSSCQFEITENNIDARKEHIVKKYAYNAANDAVKKYKYKMLKPENLDSIEIEKNA